MSLRADDGNEFSQALLAWFDVHGRRNLPWQHPRTPYRVWVSEIMLQQTQVATALPYFERFVAALPTLADLADASEDRVLGLWSGLGYYSRARNLLRAARICIVRHAGDVPRDIDALSALPGIGRSTAAAILAQAFGQHHAILDGNVRRVLARRYGVRGWPGASATQRALWEFADQHTPQQRVADYTQAIMDLGATVCTRSRPRCTSCPVARDCIASNDGLTNVLPQARSRGDKPTRATTMLIVRDARGRVLLERRPPTGVWARLWSLPETDDAASARQRLRERYAVRAGAPATVREFVHSFSHYHLRITAQLFAAAAEPSRVADDPDRCWYAPDELAALGLPAPVRRLLETLEENRWPASSTA